MTGNTMYATHDVPGKGKGLVAIKKILKGTRILCEEPIITLPEGKPDGEYLRTCIRQQVDALGTSERHAFLSMHNIHAYRNSAERYLGIIRTNALPIETDRIGGGIFLEACRINHACDNNAQKSWNEKIKRHTVHALRDIDKGEEITIYYLGLDMSRKARNKALQEKFGFACSCRLCSLPTEQSQESDERLESIHHLDSLVGQGGLDGILSSPLRTLRYVDQQVRLYDEQGPGDSGLARAFLDAAQIAIANGDLARGRIFAERAVSGWQTAYGSDCKEVFQHGYIARDPWKLELYGMSMKWKTAMDDVPAGLEPGDFEDWLWKREKPQLPGQLVDLRNRATFPGFVDLPGQKVNDPDFYESSDMVTFRPRRHWCFLAEIVDVIQLLRLQMNIKDIDGRKVPLIFYTDRRGDELASAQVQKEHTVAILYAQRHAFKFDDPGIRHENPKTIKIFPVSLQKLLEVNDLIQQFSIEIDGLRVCHGCGKKAASLKKCVKCTFFWYCGRNCQTTGWNEKRHKAICKLLRDSDLQGMFNLEWDEFDDYVQFPLRPAEKSKCPMTAPSDKEDGSDTLFKSVRRLRVSDDPVAADKTTSSDCPAAREPISLTNTGTSGLGKILEKQHADRLTQAVPKDDSHHTSGLSANLLASASNRVEEAQEIAISTGKEPAVKPYAIRALAGKGKGLVATTSIAKGTRLLSEVPVFRVPRDNNDIEGLERIVANEVKGLKDDQRRAFFDLSNIHENAHSQPLGIARTNVLPLGSNARSGGLFLEASRINHSCRHNAQNTWNEKIGRLTIHSLRDIEAEQEITISYLASTSEYAERQRYLKEKFAFECKCELCILPQAQREQSDARLRNLQVMDKLIGELFIWENLEPAMALRVLHTMLGLFDEEGIWDAGIARAYKDAYDIATANGDESRARVFAQRAYDVRRLVEGDDSLVTVKMRQAAEELPVQAPQGMDETGFEDWLWMLNGGSESSTDASFGGF